MSYVYVIKSTSNNCKIGWSKNPKRRLAQLQTGSHEKLSIALLLKCQDDFDSTRLESLLHSKYSSLRLYGEWFKVSFRDIERDVYEDKLLNSLIVGLERFENTNVDVELQ